MKEAYPCDQFDIATKKPIQSPIEATIRFRVSRKCLEEKNAQPEDVKLYHYTSEWVPLETTFIAQNEDDYIFTAKTTSFSPFASGIPIPSDSIGVKNTTPLSSPSPHSTLLPKTEKNDETTKETVSESYQRGDSILFTALLLTSILFYLSRPKNNKTGGLS